MLACRSDGGHFVFPLLGAAAAGALATQVRSIHLDVRISLRPVSAFAMAAISLCFMRHAVR